MNERIDKLLHKSGAYFGGEGVVYDSFDPKKFAELIVRECALQCRHNDDMDRIEKHFGVEP